jgi:DNA modification methylase
MAPEIALTKINNLPKNKTILDPMSGSGMVLSQASRASINSIGYDLDPLAKLISSATATRVNETTVLDALDQLLRLSKDLLKSKRGFKLHWIDEDDETLDFIKFWFYRKQINQLRCLSYYLVAYPFIRNKKVLDLLKIAVSRLIISKEPKASLARDTAHSRPHRVIEKNQFDLFEELPKSLSHVLKALKSEDIKIDAKTYLGDARKLSRISEKSIDLIITSPPYLNAIDYLRGHRLSLVWLGFSLSSLRRIRLISIGAETYKGEVNNNEFIKLMENIHLKYMDVRYLKQFYRYYSDLVVQLTESYRVLKRLGNATYVIGNSNINGIYVQNNEILKCAAKTCGFKVRKESVREIPSNNRYLPITIKGRNSLKIRMKTEHIIELVK